MEHDFIIWKNEKKTLMPVKKVPKATPKVLVKPVQPESTGNSKEVVDSQRKKILMSKEKARKTFDVIQQKDRRSESNKAELQEAPVISPRVIMVKPAPPENVMDVQNKR
uniref:Uncharacterized protein n=1 Tax=Knipowitschia caucasica TaxID=637954 RepID=A0AAV2KKC8_KNICA